MRGLLSRGLRKATTKPIWYFERRRRYSVQHRHGELPPVEGSGPAILAVLTTPGTFGDSLFAAWSWLRFGPRQFTVRLFVDGPLTAQHRSAFARLFPLGDILEVDEFIGQESGRLARAIAHLDWDALRVTTPSVKKAPLILALQQTADVLYLDCDVLCFSRPYEILDTSQQSKSTPLYNCELVPALDAVVLERARSLGLEHARSLNAGLLWVPRNSLSLPAAAALMDGWNGVDQGYFAEQTLFAVLLQHAGAMPLPRERYVTSHARQFYWEQDVDYDVVAARHFVWPVRHLVYRKGIPRLLWQAKHAPAEAGYCAGPGG